MAGAAVVLTGRGREALQRVESQITATGGQVLGVQADVASLQDSQKVIDQAMERFGRVDILVNNAAVFPPSLFVEVSEDVDKIRAVLRRLLQQWLSAVENVRDNDTVYLPYDFSDQYTGWLSCFRSGILASICLGWDTVEGWSISPSAVGHYLTHLPGFRSDGPTVQVPIKELVEAIHNSITQIDGLANHQTVRLPRPPACDAPLCPLW
jgi:hypothetical protein